MKALAHIVPRTGADGFAERMRALVAALDDRGRASDVTVAGLERLPDDPFGPDVPFGFTLELRGALAGLRSRVSGLGVALDDVVHADLSTLLIGEEAVFLEGGGPVRYQYLMRRRHDFDHARYLARYRDVHSKFGLETPGIAGYVQLHVDPDASRSLAHEAGFGTWGVDSVSELHLESLETFLAAIAKSDVGGRAIEDEGHFVDRERSVAFVSRVVD